jgi:hypothetical protein
VNRTRGVFSFDVRSQTEYGTLRSYVRAGWQWTTNTDTVGGSASTVYLDRAFIQFAGFTFGKTQSFFDVPDIADMTYQTEYTRNNTSGTGTPVFAYTAMLGNGVTATLSLEDYSERRANVMPLLSPYIEVTFNAGVDNVAMNHGSEVPDIVGNLRVDQAWGSAQVSGALHLNQASYYLIQPAGTTTAHPDDKWGWAVAAGLLLKMPWDARDTFAVAGSYAEGASTYVANVPGSYAGRSSAASLFQDGGVAVGWWDDAYYADTVTGIRGELELPKIWNVNAGFQHYWTNALRSSIWGSYTSYEASSNAVDTIICAPRGFGAGCADWNAWQVGSRTIWNPVANLDIGLEVMYTKIETAFAGGRVNCGIGIAGCVFGATPAGIPAVHNIQDNDVWSGILRIQRNFWP